MSNWFDDFLIYDSFGIENHQCLIFFTYNWRQKDGRTNFKKKQDETRFTLPNYEGLILNYEIYPRDKTGHLDSMSKYPRWKLSCWIHNKQIYKEKKSEIKK